MSHYSSVYVLGPYQGRYADFDGSLVKPSNWEPGVPLVNHPYSFEHGDPQVPREMFSLVADDEGGAYHHRYRLAHGMAFCVPCLVYWYPPAAGDRCWSCGRVPVDPDALEGEVTYQMG